MALSDRVTTIKKAMHGLPCSVGVLLDTLHGDELAALQTILADREWSQAMVWKALTDEGYEVGLNSINKHRGLKCRCATERTR